MRGPCGDLVRALCERTLAELPPGGPRDNVKAIRERLDEPLRVAVAGREKAGKSTLVNALLGVRVAQTDVGPCTKVVTRFLHGPDERAEVVLKDGERRSLELRDRRLPDDLGVPLGLVEEVAVYLSSDLLREQTIIDTPGLASLDEQATGRAEQLLAAEGADVLVYLVTRAPQEADVAAIKEFAELSSGFESTPITAVALLSKADKIGDGDPAKVAELVERVSGQLRDQVVAVLPVIGLLAETGSTGALREEHATILRALARAADEVGLDEVLEGESDVPADDVRRLLPLLDVYGLQRCLELVAQGRGGAGDLRKELEDISGIEALRSFLLQSFGAERDAVKANVALAGLERVRWSGKADRALLRNLGDGIERVRLDPALHRISELWACQACDKVGLPDERCADLRRVASRGTVAARLGAPAGAGTETLRSLADAGATRWRELMLGATFSQRRVAQVAEETYLHLFRSLDSRAAVGAA